jgi:hypothetical protein
VIAIQKTLHAYANQKHNRSRMKQIKDKKGRMCSSKEEIEEAFVDYFSDLFKAGESLEVEACVEVLERKVTAAINQLCTLRYVLQFYIS